MRILKDRKSNRRNGSISGWVVVVNRRVAAAVQEVAQPLGHRQHPLAHRQAREDVISQMRRRLHNVLGVARRAHAAPLAGESYR